MRRSRWLCVLFLLTGWGTARAETAASIPPPVNLAPLVGGALGDHDLDGVFEEVVAQSAFSVGGTRGGTIVSPFEYQGAVEFDLFSPPVQALNVNAIYRVNLTLNPLGIGSAGLFQHLTGVAAGYVGDGFFDSSDANRGNQVASFTLWNSYDPFPGPTFLNVTNYVTSRIRAADRFVGFNLRLQTLPPFGGAVNNSFSSTALTFYLTPEPTTLLLLGGGFLALARKPDRRRPVPGSRS